MLRLLPARRARGPRRARDVPRPRPRPLRELAVTDRGAAARGRRRPRCWRRASRGGSRIAAPSSPRRSPGAVHADRGAARRARTRRARPRARERRRARRRRDCTTPGVSHADLNLTNILVARRGDGRGDACSTSTARGWRPGRSARARRRSNLRRLARSLRKLDPGGRARRRRGRGARSMPRYAAATEAAVRVLIVLPGAIGDVVRALPLLGRIRRGAAGRAPRRGPSSRPRRRSSRGHPWLDEVLVLRRRDGLRALAPFARAGCAPGDWDVALDLGRGVKSALARARRPARAMRLGFARADAREGGWLLATRRLPPQGVERPKLEQFLAFGDALGLPPRAGRVRARADARRSARRPRRCSPGCAGPLVAACVGSSCPSRRWFPERDRRGARRARRRDAAASAVLLGTAADAAFARGGRARGARARCAISSGARRCASCSRVLARAHARLRSRLRARCTSPRRSARRSCRCGARPARARSTPFGSERLAIAGRRARARRASCATVPSAASACATITPGCVRRRGARRRWRHDATVRWTCGRVARLACGRRGAWTSDGVPRRRRERRRRGARGTRARQRVATAHGVVFVKSVSGARSGRRARRAFAHGRGARARRLRARPRRCWSARAAGRGLLVTRDVGGDDLLDAVARLAATAPRPAREARAARARSGARSARLHAAGFVHGDLVPPERAVRGRRRLVFLDNDRTRRSRFLVCARRPRRNLVQLGRFVGAGRHADRSRARAGGVRDGARALAPRAPAARLVAWSRKTTARRCAIDRIAPDVAARGGLPRRSCGAAAPSTRRAERREASARSSRWRTRSTRACCGRSRVLDDAGAAHGWELRYALPGDRTRWSTAIGLPPERTTILPGLARWRRVRRRARRCRDVAAARAARARRRRPLLGDAVDASRYCRARRAASRACRRWCTCTRATASARAVSQALARRARAT